MYICFILNEKIPQIEILSRGRKVHAMNLPTQMLYICVCIWRESEASFQILQIIWKHSERGGHKFMLIFRVECSTFMHFQNFKLKIEGKKIWKMILCRKSVIISLDQIHPGYLVLVLCYIQYLQKSIDSTWDLMSIACKSQSERNPNLYA